MNRSVLHRVSRTATALVAALVIGAPAAMADVVPFRSVQGWVVNSITSGGSTIRCAAGKRMGQRNMRIVTDGATWWTGLNFSGQQTGPGAVRVDGVVARVPYLTDGQFSYVRVNANWLNRIARGNNMTFEFPNGAVVRVRLVGTQAAINALQQCRQRIPFALRGQGFSARASGGGTPGAGGNPPVTPPMPVPVTPAPVPVPVPVTPVPMPVPVTPPGTPTTPPAMPGAPTTGGSPMGAGCPAVGAVMSQASDQAVTVTFDVRAATDITLYWLDGSGNPVQLGPLVAGVQTVDGHVGDAFVARDASGACLGGVMQVTAGLSSFVVQ